MKLSQEASPVEISGAISKPQEFQIKASKEAFKILSSGLYNNKILAIIRELSCNAYDAHVAAGKKDEPFYINLPTTLDTQFSVKDNGIGLSHEGVISLYTTYFGTNKSESNDYVGALGLGSKSPFCYTEGFTVVSRYNGMKRTYSCFIGDTGTPQVLLQGEEATTECNGLEVSFPVNKQDIWEFENQAKRALEFFNPKPIINTDIDIPQKDYTFKCDRWGLRNEYGGEPRAIQGMVPYEVGDIDTSRMTHMQQSIMKLPIDIFFPIGELSVAVSRESLSNDDRTINNILKAISSIGKDFLQQVKDKVKDCNSLWEARLLIFNMANTRGLGGIINDALNRGEFDGIYQKFTFSKDSSLSIKEMHYPALQIARFRRRSWTEHADKYVMTSSKEDREHIIKNKQEENVKIPFSADEETLFIINDLGFGYEKYIHYLLQNDPKNKKADGSVLYDCIYFLNRYSKDLTDEVVIGEGKRLIEAIGNPPYKMLSELKTAYQNTTIALPTKPQTPKRKYIRFQIESDIKTTRYSNDGAMYKVAGWRDGWVEATAPDPNSDKYFVLTKNLVPLEGKFENAEYFQDFVRAVVKSKKFGLPDKFVLYGLTDQSPQLKEAGWIEFTSYVFKKLVEMMTPAKELELSLLLKPFQAAQGLEEYINYVGKAKPLAEDSELQKFAVSLHEAKRSDRGQLAYLVSVIDEAKRLGIYEVKNVLDFNKAWREVAKNYPLLDFVSTRMYSLTSFDKSLDQYIILMDKEKKAREQKLFILDKEETNDAIPAIIVN